jgi:hypothetical protein
MDSDALMEECVRMMQQSFRQAPTMKKRAKSVYQQRNLGTIKERKKEKKQEQESTSEQIIMRILRMRYVFRWLCLCVPSLMIFLCVDRGHKSLLLNKCKYQPPCKLNRKSVCGKQKRGRRNELLLLHRQDIPV